LTLGVAAGAVTAGTALATFAIKGAKAFVEATAHVREFQRVTLSSAEGASRLVFAFERVGISSESASTAMGRLAKGIATGSFEAESFGIKIARSRDGTVDLDKTLLNLSDRFMGMTDATLRAELASAAFGKGWTAMIPILAKGRDGLKEIFDLAEKDHKVFSQKDLEDGKNFSLAMKSLSSAVQGLSMELGKGLVPVLTQVALKATDAAHALDSITKPLGGIGAIANKALDASPAGNFALGLKGAGDMLHGHFGEGLKKAGLSMLPLGGLLSNTKDATDKLAESQKKQGDASDMSAGQLRKLTKEFEKHEKAIRDSQKALDAHLAGQLGVEAATYSMQEAEWKLNDERAKGKDNFEEIRRAELAYKEGIVATSQAIRDKVAEENTGLGAAKAMSLATEQQISWLANMADSLAPDNPLRVFLLQYIDDLKKTTGTYTATMDVDTSTAMGKLKALQAKLAELEAAQYLSPNDPASYQFYDKLPGRAAGGPVSAWQPYIVGENGPEMFVPSSSGTIVPHGAGGGATGGGATIIQLVLDGRVISEVVRRDLVKTGKRNNSALGAYA
ncbi:MAG TPA: hypothetical protein VK481_03650, partial [Gemmatimonadaceae bacterium]|nr:hypothetical protein [Gemmatimonadaceae bacterium]